MIQAPLEVYRIDMKYIRNLHNIDDRVLSVSPRDLTNTANVLYTKYVLGEKFAAREQCLDFKRMEIECKKFVEKKK